MKTLFLIFMFPSFFTSPNLNTETLTQSFSIHQFTHSIVVELDGDVEVVHWDKNEIHAEITITEITAASEYSLNYAIQKGHYNLVCDFGKDMDTIFLKHKKINTSIFSRGHKQKTKQTFKLFIPKQVKYSLQ